MLSFYSFFFIFAQRGVKRISTFSPNCKCTENFIWSWNEILAEWIHNFIRARRQWRCRPLLFFMDFVVSIRWFCFFFVSALHLFPFSLQSEEQFSLSKDSRSRRVVIRVKHGHRKASRQVKCGSRRRSFLPQNKKQHISNETHTVVVVEERRINTGNVTINTNIKRDVRGFVIKNNREVYTHQNEAGKRGMLWEAYVFHMQNERKYRTAENETTTKKSRRIIENKLLSKTRLSSSYLDVNIGIKRKRKITLRLTNNGEWISERDARGLIIWGQRTTTVHVVFF